MGKQKEIHTSDVQIAFADEAESIREWIRMEMKRWVQIECGLEVDIRLGADDERDLR